MAKAQEKTKEDRAKQTALIASQNDRFRTNPAGSGFPGRFVLTAGVAEYGDGFAIECIAAMQAYDSFSEDNDPYHTHEMGLMTIRGERVYWKIDLYDVDYRMGSDDPSNPEVTRRVLTVLLAREY
jgi:hypothetical protein